MPLEFSSSIMCLTLAGKVGCNIASEIGALRDLKNIVEMDCQFVCNENRAELR